MERPHFTLLPAMFVNRLIVGLWAALLLCGGVTARAQNNKVTSPPRYVVVDIPRLPLKDALREFGRQTNQLISFWPDARINQDAMIGPLKGEFITADAALNRLVAATGLVVERTNERSVVVMAPSMSGGSRSAKSRARWVDPDAPVYFNIPRLPLSDALASFTKTLHGYYRGLKASDAVAASNIWVGPVKGRMTPRKAFKKLTAHVCAVSLYEEAVVELTEDGKPVKLQYRSAGPQIKPPIEWNIPRMSRERALDEVALKFSRIKFLYFSRNVDGVDQELVGPITGRMSANEALDVILSGTDFVVRWVDDIQPTISIEPAKQAFVANDCRETVLVTDSSLHDFAYSSVVTITRQQIADAGASSLPELLQHVSATAYTWAAGYRANGAQSADGRGVGQVLVTINGRRTFASAQELSRADFDLNSIPIAAIDRVEIVTDSSSTIKGLDAIGGLINIVLRQPTNGVVAEIQYGTAQGGGRERRVTAHAGGELGQAQGSVIVDMLEVGDLLGAERNRYADQDYRRYRPNNADLRSRNSSPGNFSSLDGEYLPGMLSTFAAIPEGASTLSVDDLIVNTNYTSLARFQSVAPARRRVSVVSNGNLTLGPLSIDAEALYTTQDTEFHFPPPTVSGVLAAEHPQNPFGRPVIYEGLLPGLGTQQYQTQSEWFRAALGIQADLLGWTVGLSLLHSHERSAALLTKTLNPFFLARSLSSSDPNTALDILASDGGAVGRGLMTPSPTMRFGLDGSQVSALADGKLATLPAGDLRLQLGAEFRHESGQFPNGVGAANRGMHGVFAQLHAPLMGDGLGVPGIRELSLITGARIDDYDGVDSGLLTQHALVWAPTTHIKVRAGHSKRFRMPSVVEQNAPLTTLQIAVFDEARHQTAVTDVHLGGREDLQPTQAASTTLGVVIKSPKRWTLSADYWRTSVTDRIAFISEQQVLANENALPDRVQRAAPTPADIAAGIPGALQSIDIRLDNVGSLRASGVDVAFEQEIPVVGGRLTPRAGMTWVDEFRYSDLPAIAGSTTNRVGVASDRGTIPRFKFTGSVTFDTEAGRLGGHVRCHPRYRDRERNGTVSKHYVSGRCFVDISASTQLRGLDLTLGVSNLFNTQPGYSNIRTEGYDYSQGDMRLRFGYASLRYGF